MPDDRNRNSETHSGHDQNDRSQQQESEKGGSFHDRVEKLERPGEWPEPPPEKE